ncbi:DUF7118 family protein [Halegenticoccus soli]|uniref:DUF7118 family protein n=1 Tax=Halegenticoccus soli TaxID=1985678 RepID=UPI000C6EFEEE|nr:hypothetical protein [Halegenticoccus soli]
MTGAIGGAESETAPEIDDLAAAREDLRAIRSEIEEIGERRVEAVAEAHEEALGLLRRYEGPATGTGDFGAYLEFQESFVELVEGLPDELPARDAFEGATEAVDRRRLRERDFDRAREALSDAAEIAALLDDRAEARDRRDRARHAVEERVDALNDRLSRLKRVRRLGDADFDAPVEELCEPIRAYNRAVRDEFEAFKREASARDLLGFVESTGDYPLVGYDRPPADLLEYVASNPAGERPVPTLLSYADYSNSKLDHYVDDPAALKRCVSVNRTYLERLDADPLSVSWPPPPAAELRYRARELIAVCGRFAGAETVAKARSVRDLAADAARYDRLRRTAVAREELDESERRRLAAGEIEREAEVLREERAALREALEKEGGRAVGR